MVKCITHDSPQWSGNNSDPSSDVIPRFSISLLSTLPDTTSVCLSHILSCSDPTVRILPKTPSVSHHRAVKPPTTMTSLTGQNILITGASRGIGATIAKALAQHGANLILFARSGDRLAALSKELHRLAGGEDKIKVFCTVVDVSSHEQVNDAVANVVEEAGPIDVLINNAGLALGAPNAFPDLTVEDIGTMSGTNITGFMWVVHAVLNAGKMHERKHGTILNITSTTGLEIPPFPGEAVYHASKAFQEAFSNVLRNELVGTNIKVLTLRPGVVATHFHTQRVGFDKGAYDDFMSGFEPLLAEDVAEAAVWMLSQKERVAVKALDVVPSAQRTLQVFDREWNKRNGASGETYEGGNAEKRQ